MAHDDDALAMADDDDAFAMHLGVMGSKLSFSERLNQARQLDALLEAFSEDSDDSGAAAPDRSSPARTLRFARSLTASRILASTSTHPHPGGDEWSVGAGAVAAALPRGTFEVAAARRLTPTLSASAAASAASTRVPTACSSSSRQQSSSGAAHPLLLPLPSLPCPDGAQVRSSSTLLTHVLNHLMAHCPRTHLRAGVESVPDATPGGTGAGAAPDTAPDSAPPPGSAPGARRLSAARSLYTTLGSEGRCGAGLDERRSGGPTLRSGGGGVSVFP